MTQKVKVLFLWPHTYLAPPWSVCAQIARHLNLTVIQKFALLDDALNDGFGVEPRHQMTVLRMPLGSAIARARRGSIGAAFRLVRALFSGAAYVRREGIDIIHTTDDLNSLLIGLAIAKLSGRKLLVHYHTQLTIFGGFRLRLTKLVGRRAACNVAVSRYVADQLQALRVEPAPVTYVLNGTDPDRFNTSVDGSRLRAEYGFAKDDIVAMQLSRIWQMKRPEDFVRALAIARKRVANLKGLIVGWEDPRYIGPFPSYTAELLDIAEKEGVSDALVIGSVRPEAPELHALADIAVLPSLDDPCPLVVVEAMSTGKPFVGSRDGGIPEMVSDGRTGYLVTPRSPAELAERLVQLANDPAERLRLSNAARADVLAFFNEERVAADFERIYVSLVRGQPIPLPNLPRAASSGTSESRRGDRVS